MPTNNPQMSNGAALSWQLQLPFHSKQEIKNVFQLKLVIPPSSPLPFKKSLQGRSVFGPQRILVPAAKKEEVLACNSASCPMRKTCLGLFSIKVTEHLHLWNWEFLTFSSLYQNFPPPPSFPSVFCQRGTIFQGKNWMKCSKVCKKCREILHQFGPQPIVLCLVDSISQDGGQPARSFKSPTCS